MDARLIDDDHRVSIILLVGRLYRRVGIESFSSESERTVEGFWGRPDGSSRDRLWLGEGRRREGESSLEFERSVPHSSSSPSLSP